MNLFTEDARRVNEVSMRRIEDRQASGQVLFENVNFDYNFDPYERILNNAENLTLFSSPIDFSNINSGSENEELSYWLLASFVLIGISLGLFLALRSTRANVNEKPLR
ncbi:MAG: hypothetical protein FWE02_04785 [Defluviitaleaceae bacterium]|nr:hypothetical protein [Defluviitaleaceae bacterium]